MIGGSLYPSEFLLEGITEYDRWETFAGETLDNFEQTIHSIFEGFPTNGNPIEATTEADLIEPIMKALGWEDFLSQQTLSQKGRMDIPDYLLFENKEKKALANSEREQATRYRHGLAVLEAKAWAVELDRRSSASIDRVPSSQILRYLTGAAVQSDDNIQWGILTNGRIWRLYYNKAKSKSEEYLEIDLGQVLGIAGIQGTLPLQPKQDSRHVLRLFGVLFGRSAFIPYKQWPSFQEAALAESRLWEEAVAKDLREVVFGTVFPELLNCLQSSDPNKPQPVTTEYLEELRESALILLYRLLFLLYAEDRHLLPIDNSVYQQYSLQQIRDEIAKKLDSNAGYSKQQDNLFYRLKSVFTGLDKGDSEMGLPPYNGGLFHDGGAPILDRARIPDATFAAILDNLSRRQLPKGKKWINYRDLSVQQLGSIYEGLLEYHPVLSDEGIVIQPNIFARRTSGSYYTSDSLVKLIIEKTLGPLLAERLEAFRNKAEELKTSSSKKSDRLGLLKRIDPATAILELKVCDPAMGSGHFLVSLVDYLADNVLVAMDEAENAVLWADASNPYKSPLSARIEDIRRRILDQAAVNSWRVDVSQLDDRQIVRRMILKRCVYGVDKNPMAVELAKVSLWLHTFTVGAPLSFLDHHLRSGDSLFGEWVGGVIRELEIGPNRKAGSGKMYIGPALDDAKPSAQAMAAVEELADTDIAEVAASSLHFERVQALTHKLDSFLRLYQAFKWLVGKDNEKTKAWNQYLYGIYGNPVEIAVGEEPQGVDATFADLLQEARTLAKEEGFMNWEVAFPLVWTNWSSEIPQGGFDAVIGNPPWDRMKLQQVEWFEARRREIAAQSRAADRKKMIAALEKKGDPLWEQFQKADERAKTAAEMARKCGQYPLLSGGDTNLYSLFVERAHALVKPKGIVGLLVPSGISADKTASVFFKKVAGESRLAHLYDFENKKVFFPDVHASFKFSVYVAGGNERSFERSQLAFYLHNVAELLEEERVFELTAADFLKVNPNTGTAPIFRSRKDAELTRRIYSQLPVLNDHQKGMAWPVRYTTMFHMTNDSGLFRTKAELEKLGCYPVEMGRWKRGDDIYLPLYEGKSIYHFNHRYSSVDENPNSLHSKAISTNASVLQLTNPTYFPKPRFYVAANDVSIGQKYFLGFRDVTNPTNERTMVAAISPNVGAGNTLVQLLHNESDIATCPFLLANFNSYVFDFVARQKVQGQHLSWFIVEQLPVLPPERYTEALGKTTVGEFVQRLVLELSYTAWDLQPFAQDLGYTGDPFPWDENRRRHLRAKLDALYFLLYGLNEEEARYVLGTFPIVKKDDESTFGRYLTQDLILAYMRALRAGDTEVMVSI